MLPSQTAPSVSTRSITASTRFSSSLAPPSWLTWVLRWKPVATRWLTLASGSRSPASCSTLNWSKGMSALSACTTQSRQGQIERLPSTVKPWESA